MGENTRDIAGLVECFSVIGEIPRCSDILVCGNELMIHESLLINKYRPNLNVQGSSIPLNLF